MPEQEDDINQRKENRMSPNSMAAHMLEKFLTWLEHQSEVNQYNTCTLRDLHALTSLETRRVPKAEDLTRVATKVRVRMYEHMHVYLYNVVLDYTLLIRTKCVWHLTNMGVG